MQFPGAPRTSPLVGEVAGLGPLQRRSMRGSIERVIVLCCIVTAAGCAAKSEGAAAAPADSAAVSHAFHARSDGLQRAEAAKDAETSASFYAEDAIVQPPGAPQIAGKANILALYKSYFGNASLKDLRGTPSSATISASGDLAYEGGVNRIVFGSPKGDLVDMGKYVIVWKHERGDWYVSALAFSSDAAAPVPASATK
jgi:ketosteroid isomerase-like protein